MNRWTDLYCVGWIAWLASRKRKRKRSATPPRRIIGGVGRLSPEKGFDQLVEAAALACGEQPDLGFVVFGDGPLRESLTAQIARHGLGQRFILAGFQPDVG